MEISQLNFFEFLLQNGGLYSNELQNATVTLNYNSTICQLAYEIYNDAYMICTGGNGLSQ
jgi:hypothetical protein